MFYKLEKNKLGKVVKTELMYRGKSALRKERFWEKVLRFFKRKRIF